MIEVELNRMNAPCKVYKRRWIMLLIFCLTSALNSFHWIEYSIIANIITNYYNISDTEVNWTSMIYMITYVPLVFPATLFLEKNGLRQSMIICLSMMTFGAWLKLLSLNKSYFSVAFIAQFIIGSAQVFILSVPPRLSSLWFDATQVSTACAIGVFGNQLGIALTFVIVPMVVHNSDEHMSIGSELKYLHIGNAIPTTLLLILTWMLFEAKPPLPPSLAQFSANENEEEKNFNFIGKIGKLLKNKDYMLLLLSYGLNLGVFYSYSSLLNQMYLLHFPEGEQEAGWIGLTLISLGMFGSVLWGVALDKFHIFKRTSLFVYSMGLVGMLSFTFSLINRLVPMVYFSSAVLGFSMTGYQTVAYEFAAELTYPIPESISSGLLNAGGEALGIILVFGAGLLLDQCGDLPANLLFSAVLSTGLVITIFVSGKKLRRLAASQINL